MSAKDVEMSSKHPEVHPKDLQPITYRGVGLAAFTPNPKIKWHSSAKKTSAAPSKSASETRTTPAG